MNGMNAALDLKEVSRSGGKKSDLFVSGLKRRWGKKIRSR